MNIPVAITAPAVIPAGKAHPGRCPDADSDFEALLQSMTEGFSTHDGPEVMNGPAGSDPAPDSEVLPAEHNQVLTMQPPAPGPVVGAAVPRADTRGLGPVMAPEPSPEEGPSTIAVSADVAPDEVQGLPADRTGGILPAQDPQVIPGHGTAAAPQAQSSTFNAAAATSKTREVPVPAPAAAGAASQDQALPGPGAKPGPAAPAPAATPGPGADGVQEVTAPVQPLRRPAAFHIPEGFTAVQTAPAEPSIGQTAPVQGPVPAGPAPQSAPAAPLPAPPTVPQPLHTQLAKPMFSLAAAGDGEHVMTMKVTPEELGTVTVRAVIGPDGVRMELFASDAGREAVKAIMPELRRELAGAGMAASLDLGSGSGPDGQSPNESRGRPAAEHRQQEKQSPDEQPLAANQRMFIDGAASLDVLA